MGQFQLKYKPFGNEAILIEWPNKITIGILNDIRNFVVKIENKNIKEIIDLNFVYSSLLILYDSKGISHETLKRKLNSIYSEEILELNIENVLWEIPVCYHPDFGIDLDYISSKKNIDIDTIISLHCNSIYTVFGIGFLPGFLYLGGLLEMLHFPRKETPRLKVPKGTVGIGGNQTGIYPKESPGGWQIIGKTPVSLFDVKKDIPCKIKAGDKIQFCPISKLEFSVIKELEADGKYKLKEVITND